jgi:translation initiation factor IF-2
VIVVCVSFVMVSLFYEGKLASLKRFKDDVKEVKLGYECGAMIEKFNDIKVDDVIEGFVMEEINLNWMNQLNMALRLIK